MAVPGTLEATLTHGLWEGETMGVQTRREKGRELGWGWEMETDRNREWVREIRSDGELEREGRWER